MSTRRNGTVAGDRPGRPGGSDGTVTVDVRVDGPPPEWLHAGFERRRHGGARALADVLTVGRPAIARTTAPSGLFQTAADGRRRACK